MPPVWDSALKKCRPVDVGGVSCPIDSRRLSAALRKVARIAALEATIRSGPDLHLKRPDLIDAKVHLRITPTSHVLNSILTHHLLDDGVFLERACREVMVDTLWAKEFGKRRSLTIAGQMLIKARVDIA